MGALRAVRCARLLSFPPVRRSWTRRSRPSPTPTAAGARAACAEQAPCPLLGPPAWALLANSRPPAQASVLPHAAAAARILTHTRLCPRRDDVQRALGQNERALIAASTGPDAAPFGPTFVYGYPGVAFEVLRSGRIAAVTLFESAAEAIPGAGGAASR